MEEGLDPETERVVRLVVDPGGGRAGHGVTEARLGPTAAESSQPDPAQPAAWLYLSRADALGGPADGTDDPEAPQALAARVSSLAAGPLVLGGRLQVRPTACGVVAALFCAEDAERLVTADLSGLLGEPVHVTRLVGCRRTVLLPDVPRAIPVKDITAALQKQGIPALSVERHRHLVQVELQDVAQSNALLRDGLDFFGAVRFRALSERAGAGCWWRRDAPVTGTTSPTTPSPHAGEHPGAEGGGRGGVDVLQCYRCQGFWHVAGHCRHIPRCVRCGEPHTVEFCPRPRHDPICCHCAGPHHAAFRECPVRRQLINAIPISISMTTSGCGILTPAD